jgi:ABC-type branched-subunit amino acid transport system ATPase component
VNSSWQKRLGDGAPLLPLVVLAALQLSDQAILSAFNVLIPNIRDAFHLSDAGILTIASVAGAAALVCTIPVAWLADRRPRLRIALVGATLGALFSIGLGLAWTSIIAAVMLAGVSMGQAVIFPTHNSLVTDYYPVNARATVFSILRAGVSVGTIIGLLGGAALAHTYGWRTPFFVFAVPILVLVAVGFRLREPRRGIHEQEALLIDEANTDASGDDHRSHRSLVGEGGAVATLHTPAEDPPTFGEAWRLVWKIGVLRRIFFALPFLAASVVGFVSLASLQYQETFHLGVLQRGLIIAPVQVFDLIGLAAGAVIATKLAAKSRQKVFTMIGVAATAASAFAVLFALAPDVGLAFVGNAGIDASLAVIGPGVLAALSLAIPARVRSLGFSIGALFILPGLVVIPIVGGIGDAIGLRYGLLLLVPVFVIGGLIVASAGSLVEADIHNVWTSMRARTEMLTAREEGALPLLSVRELSVGYEGVPVLTSVDIEIGEREIVAILGTNGAGKSTLLRAIGGVTEASGGAIIFDGRDITHAPPDEIARHGIAQAPGGEGVFPGLTVEENLRAAAWQQRQRRGEVGRRVREALANLPTIAGRRRDQAGDLSGGQQQQLALAMALMSEPKLLLIDELSLGLAPIVVEQLLESVRALCHSGTSVLLVEQSVNVAVAVADRAYVLDGGTVRFSGTADELRAQPQLLRSVYLAHAASGLRATDGDDGDGDSDDSKGPAALAVQEVSVSFGGIAALSDVGFEVARGRILGVIGPNGAGKTTLFDVISGFVSTTAGRVLIGGIDVSSQAAAARSRQGLGRSFQDSRLFRGMTVRDTLAVSFERFIDVADPLNAILRLPSQQRTEAAVAERIDELIELFGLGRFTSTLVGELSTGSRRLVDLAGVVAHRPSVVLLDEPTSGIAQREVEAMTELLRRVRGQLDATLVVVEHDIAFIGDLADDLVALDQGSVLAIGSPAEVLGRDDVVEAFLGTDALVRQRSGVQSTDSNSNSDPEVVGR